MCLGTSEIVGFTRSFGGLDSGLWSFLRQAFIAATDVYCLTAITTVTLV